MTHCFTFVGVLAFSQTTRAPQAAEGREVSVNWAKTDPDVMTVQSADGFQRETKVTRRESTRCCVILRCDFQIPTLFDLSIHVAGKAGRWNGRKCQTSSSMNRHMVMSDNPLVGGQWRKWWKRRCHRAMAAALSCVSLWLKGLRVCARVGLLACVIGRRSARQRPAHRVQVADWG